MKRLAIALVVAASPFPALAQEAGECGPRIEEVAGNLPDLSENPQGYEELGLSEEQLEAVLATLDAARIVQDEDAQGCMALVDAAESILERGSGS